MNRVLITGGNGFLGSNLTRFFLKKDYKVMVISRSSINLTDILESIEFVKHLDPGYLQFTNQIKTFLPTVVIHCAWDGANAYKDLNNLNQIKNITQSTELLQVLITLSIKPVFVGVGTFSEYGLMNSLTNETTPDFPINLYGLTKSSFKNISNMICDQNNIRWIWVRPCLIYGQYDVSTRLIPTLIRKLHAGENVILDSCNTIVDYLHVEDFCNGVFMFIQSSSGIVNLSSGKEQPVRLLIEYIQKEIGNSTVTFDSTRDRINVSKYSGGNSDKLKSWGWKPSIDIYDGLRELIQKTKHM